MKQMVSLLFVLLAACLMVGCETPCPLFGNKDDIYPGSIVKFKEGQDMSNHVYAYVRDYNGSTTISPSIPSTRPIALHQGYYIMNEGGFIDPSRMLFLTITYDDFYGGVLPEGWVSHWQDYCDTISNPFAEIYEILGDACEKNAGIPFYCDHCDSTFCVDITMLNRMLDEDLSFLTNSSYIIPRFNSHPTKHNQ